MELKLNAQSKLCDVALNDMNSIVRCKILVCTVLRGGKAVAPDGNFVLREGDRIFVTAPSNELTTLLHNLGIITHKVKRVLVCGGGRVTFYLAKQLEKAGLRCRLWSKTLRDASACPVCCPMQA